MKMQRMAAGLALTAGIAGWMLILSSCVERQSPKLTLEKQLSAPASRWSKAEYAAMAERGQKVFTSQCARCHTVNGLANVPAPDLSDYGSEGWTHLRTADFVHDAQRYYPGTNMPTFDEKAAKKKDERLTNPQIDDITAYVISLVKRAEYLPENQKERPAK